VRVCVCYSASENILRPFTNHTVSNSQSPGENPCTTSNTLCQVQRQISDTYESLRKLQLRRVAEEEKMLQREIKERQMEKAQTQERLKQLRGKESVIDVEIAKEKRKYNAIAERQFERMFHKN